jgi:hypothetical protein
VVFRAYSAGVLPGRIAAGELRDDGGNETVVGEGRRVVIVEEFVDATIAIVGIERATSKRLGGGGGGIGAKTGAISIEEVTTEGRGETTMQEKILLGGVDAIQTGTGAEIGAMLAAIDKSINEMFRIRIVGAIQEESTQAEMIKPLVVEIKKVLLGRLVREFHGKKNGLRNKVWVGIRDE